MKKSSEENVNTGVFSILENLTLKNKMIYMLIIPILALIYFAQSEMRQSMSLVSENEKIRVLAHFSVKASSMVHELQKERGASAGYLGSGGTKFVSELPAQHKQSDVKISELTSFLKDFDTSDYGEEFSNQLDGALANLSQLEQKRESILKQELAIGDALKYYTKSLNAPFLKLSGSLATLSSSGKISVMAGAYANFLQSKERAGVERAVLTGTFAKDIFAPGMFNKFQSLVSIQDTYMNVFLNLASSSQREFYNNTMTGEAIDETRRMRGIAMDNSNMGGFNVDAGHWFKMQTAKINLLKKVEDKLSVDLTDVAGELKAQAKANFRNSLILVIFSMAITIFFAVYFVRVILKQLGDDPARIKEIADEIAAGNLDMDLDTGDKDATGVFASMKEMQEQLTAVIEKDVQSIVNSAKVGDLKGRIPLEDKQGCFKDLSNTINELVDVSEQVVNDTVRVFGAMAEGGLTELIEAEYKGSFDQLKQDANSTVGKLTEVIGEIKSSADEIKTAATEISQGNVDLSQRTEEQASSLEETASSMEELTGTVKQNADNARQANQLADSAREQAEKGGGVVSNAITAMGEISTSSGKISDIIGVIDEIAFQTNLLALNAAVEAARAGEQGRGFAVVASEVRNLAQRSAEAAKEIKTLINDSVNKVEDGSKLVDESGKTLGEIVLSVKKVSDIIAEIAAASEEQSSGIEEVNKAVAQMDEMTQQNAALVEEAAAASESMDEQAQNMGRMMAFFDTGNGQGAVINEDKETAVERRLAEARPWTDEAPQASASPAAKLQKTAAAGGGDDGEWEEF